VMLRLFLVGASLRCPVGYTEYEYGSLSEERRDIVGFLLTTLTRLHAGLVKRKECLVFVQSRGSSGMSKSSEDRDG